MSNEHFKDVDDVLKEYKDAPMVFKRAEEAIKHFGWDVPIRMVEVRRDANRKLPCKVPAAGEACEGKRDSTNDATDISGPSVG